MLGKEQKDGLIMFSLRNTKCTSDRTVHESFVVPHDLDNTFLFEGY